MPGPDPKAALTEFLTRVGGPKNENIELASDFPTNDVIRSQMFDWTIGHELGIPFLTNRADRLAKTMVSWERKGREEAVIGMGQLSELRKMFAGPEGESLKEKLGL
jgi:hypothetical protein